MNIEKINNNIKPYVLRLLMQGYLLEDFNDNQIIKLSKDNNSFYVYIHTNQTPTESFKSFDAFLEKSTEFYLLSETESQLYTTVKRNFYTWINHRLGGLPGAKSKKIEVNFAHVKKNPLKWEKVSF